MGMKNAGRNDPCPCGSGRKYKQCCLNRDREAERATHSEQRAREERNVVFARAIHYLEKNYRDELRDVLNEIFSAVPDRQRHLSEAEEEYRANAAIESAVAEGIAEIDGKRVRLRDLVLKGGMPATVEQRRWFESSTAEPLRLWRVKRVEPGMGMELQDPLDEAAEPIWVKERSASRTVKKQEMIAARVALWEGHREFTLILALPGHSVFHLLDLIEKIVAKKDPEPAPWRISRAILRYWIERYSRPIEIPTLVAPSGERIELTTDHWQILDAEEFERRLAAEPDVRGNPERGWSRLKDPKAQMSSTVLALNPGKRADRLEVFARTRKMAADGKRWLKRVAGPSLRFISREIVDTASEEVWKNRPAPSDEDSLDIQPEVKTKALEQFYRNQYAGIGDKRLPVLGDMSPREALKDEAGKRRVRVWLEGFEVNENRMAAADGREPVDLGFLWREVGMERPE